MKRQKTSYNVSVSIKFFASTGTSNWSEGYFTQTAGVGLVVNQTGSEAG